MAKTEKCGNPPCNCIATDGSGYCSAYCAGAEERTTVGCHCGHLECEGEISEAAPAEGATIVI